MICKRSCEMKEMEEATFQYDVMLLLRSVIDMFLLHFLVYISPSRHKGKCLLSSSSSRERHPKRRGLYFVSFECFRYMPWDILISWAYVGNAAEFFIIPRRPHSKSVCACKSVFNEDRNGTWNESQWTTRNELKVYGYTCWAWASEWVIGTYSSHLPLMPLIYWVLHWLATWQSVPPWHTDWQWSPFSLSTTSSCVLCCCAIKWNTSLLIGISSFIKNPRIQVPSPLNDD